MNEKPAVPMMNEFEREAARLTTNYVSTRSVAIVIRDRAGNTSTGTSTCIQVGRALLLATAGHVIEDIDDERIELIPAAELSTARLTFTARSCNPKRPPPTTDVAWIQLEPAVAKDNRLRFLTLGDLKPNQPFDRNHPFLAHGYPYESAIFTPSALDVESTVAYTLMPEQAELAWNIQAHQVIFEYPPRDANHRPMPAPHPHGMSGGGIWLHPRHDEALVYSPELLRLVAITTKWNQSAGILIATRIEAWLDLVAQDFPEARDEIHHSSGGAEAERRTHQ
jgi:hypothetical protein